MRTPRRRAAILALAFALGLELAGQAWSHAFPPSRASAHAFPAERVVQLRAAPLPVIGFLAVHTFFVAYDPREKAWHRHEVWQDPDATGLHVRRDLMPPDEGVGGAEPWIDREWHGADAERIATALAATGYPYAREYLAWPGPNCNTYTAWVLRQANVGADLPPRAVGKDYLGLAGAARTTTGTGFQLETPLLGLKLGLRDGVELHVLEATFGLDVLPPAIKTPFGRVGFDE
jgi:hypothetical protein